MDPIKLGLLGRLLYNLFIRKHLKKAVENSKNTIDDMAFRAIDRVANGEPGYK